MFWVSSTACYLLCSLSEYSEYFGLESGFPVKG